MALDPGLLRHRVTFQRLADVLDSNGDPDQDPVTGEVSREWQDVATVWARIRPSSAREFRASGATQDETSADITIRQRSDINAGMRGLHGAKIYNVQGVLADDVSGLEYLTLPCTEGVNEGE